MLSLKYFARTVPLAGRKHMELALYAWYLGPFCNTDAFLTSPE